MNKVESFVTGKSCLFVFATQIYHSFLIFTSIPAFLSFIDGTLLSIFYIVYEKDYMTCNRYKEDAFRIMLSGSMIVHFALSLIYMNALFYSIPGLRTPLVTVIMIILYIAAAIVVHVLVIIYNNWGGCVFLIRLKQFIILE